MWAEVKYLFLKEVTLEWRQKYAFNGLLLFTVSTIFIIYLSLRVKNQAGLPDHLWNALFWIIILFSAINAVAKSFLQESPGRQLYYYISVHPISLIMAKMIYNSLLMVVLAVIAVVVYGTVLGYPVINTLMFASVVALASVGISSVLTMMSAIASKAGNNTVLMAILSLPLLIPILLLSIKAVKNAIDDLTWADTSDELITLAAVDCIGIALGYVLFPFLWKS
ncbi:MULTISPECIES: heme exporter protein CcmB [unclassified Imperialibacter]|jgi:heme exporter protein B|uniref:heme exporter protein CcmB n=1 Tax=unclassified Imperialibacter TaxID=2629706 RepID=UPI001253CB41|nr:MULTISPECIES: heme exporter protein CcmB [unclassified Imperialibacter]CAD5268308.1 Heme exporter protein B [Imperialibacter sp. 89]CAD5296840.1 Heme exporter protein B [Imperialibacter sp. 75]VVT33916.1 Heme exporter protein B [Imperialibacter sp. EC-SDR9]